MSSSDSRFDALAAEWDDDPMRRERAEKVAAAVSTVAALSSKSRVREEGAGTGLIGRLLLPSVGSLTLADPSAGMREQALRMVPAERRADVRVVDSFADDSARYDLVLATMALHHVPEPLPALTSWASLLSLGGWLAVADLDTEDGSFHGPEVDDVHLGFDRDVVAEWFGSLGLSDVRVSTVYEIVKNEGRVYPVFLVMGRRG